ncbi:type IV toxin-antitoxin system AbiEi family antitoxin domain-containing protein [Arthrobacter sp. zg-Y238]|uniref:type IV toxin-antitoxin system AbiEi family antitoxin domain-containing protein n=1 Tax=Arthrobacter sp. zg-Y238 TaxID=2964614 RepID=UPI00351CD109
MSLHNVRIPAVCPCTVSGSPRYVRFPAECPCTLSGSLRMSPHCARIPAECPCTLSGSPGNVRIPAPRGAGIVTNRRDRDKPQGFPVPAGSTNRRDRDKPQGFSRPRRQKGCPQLGGLPSRVPGFPSTFESMDPELIFTADAEAHGTDRRALASSCRSGQLIRLRHGVYMQADEWQGLSPWEQQRVRIRAAVEQGHGQRVLIQQSAAVMWGLPVIGNSAEVLLLAVPPIHGQRRGGLHWVERQLLEPLTALEDVPLTSRAQTVLDMAAYLPFEHAVPAMDHVLRPILFVVCLLWERNACGKQPPTCPVR